MWTPEEQLAVDIAFALKKVKIPGFRHVIVVTREGPRHSIAESFGKQCRGAVHGAGFAIGHRLGFRIQQLAIDHLSYHQHVVPGRVFTYHLALKPGQASSKGTPTRPIVHCSEANLSGPARAP